MIGKRLRSLPFIFANDNYTLRCTIEFCHCYSASHHPANVRDHDNLETRAVLNVIEWYLLTSDSGIYCSNVQTSCWGVKDQTVILIRHGKIPVCVEAGEHADF